MNSFSLMPLRAMVLAAGMLLTAPALAVPPDGSDAPPIKLRNLDGTEVSTAAMAPKALVLIFGETDNDKTKQACADILDAIKDPRLSADSVVALLVTARDVPEAQIKDEIRDGRYPALILRDPKREAA